MTGRYEFIKIENTREGQLAYMLDTERGVVVIAPVEWMGEVQEDKEAEVVRPQRVMRREFVQEREREEVDPRDLIDLPDPRKAAKVTVPAPSLKNLRAKDIKTNSIVPPSLRGVFIKAGKQGADTETREA